MCGRWLLSAFAALCAHVCTADTCDKVGCDCTGDVLKRCRFAAAARREVDLSGQQLGGILMLAIGTPVYLVGALVLAARVVREETA